MGSTARTLLAIVVVATLVVGGLSAAVFYGACTTSDQVSCSIGGPGDTDGTDSPPQEPGDGLSGPGDTERPPDNGTDDGDEESDEGANGDDNQEESNEGTNDDNQEESQSGNDSENASENGGGDDAYADAVNTTIDAPAYPPRTPKAWDRTITFPEDPGETVASGDNWTVSSEAVERYVARMVNDYRADRGLERLDYSHALASVSRAHSGDMYERDYFDHVNPEGEHAWHRWGHSECRSNPPYGENIFKSWAGVPLRGEPAPLYTAEALAENALEGWQNSTAHDELLRTPNYDAVGYGVHFGPTRDRDYGYRMLVTMNVCAYN